MLTTLAYTIALVFGQGSTAASNHAEVQYRVKVAGIHGLIATPLVRTIDGQAAVVTFDDRENRECKLTLTPRVEADSKISTALSLVVTGHDGQIASLQALAHASTFLSIFKQRKAGQAFTALSASQAPPRLKGDDLGISVTGAVFDPNAQEAPASHARTDGSVPGTLVYKFELSDAKHLLSKPVVRTLDGQSFAISQMGEKSSMRIAGLPTYGANGELRTSLQVQLNGEDPITIEASGTSEHPSRA